MKPYEIAAEIKPSKRQLEWQKTEFYGFINIGLPTVLNREWTDGNVDPVNFVPDKFDAEEWVTFFKEAGFKGMVLNVKHHDGFCLWYSKLTDYTIENSVNWEVEDRDMVKLLSEECKRQGIKFGIAISPLDRHAESYGKGEEYNEYFKKLLREILTNYGEIFYVRFDGAAEDNGKDYTQEYDWEGYYEVVRECQPDAVIALVGPDVRWYGNEWGVIRKNEWSVVPKYYSIEEAIKRSKYCLIPINNGGIKLIDLLLKTPRPLIFISLTLSHHHLSDNMICWGLLQDCINLLLYSLTAIGFKIYCCHIISDAIGHTITEILPTRVDKTVRLSIRDINLRVDR